jgi:hypothetical protein
MTQDERLPGRETDAGMGTGLIHRYYRIFTTYWKFPVAFPFLKPELSPRTKACKLCRDRTYSLWISNLLLYHYTTAAMVNNVKKNLQIRNREV